MCPVCAATAMLTIGLGVVSAGGLAAIAIKKIGGKNAVAPRSASSTPISTPIQEERHG